MNTANVAALTTLYAHFNEAGDAGAVLDCLHPDIAWTTDPAGFDPGGTYVGKAAVEAYINGLLSAFERVCVEPVESVPVGDDRVLVRTRVRGRAFRTHAEVSFEWAHLWRTAGELVVDVQTFLDWERAKDAAGLRDAAARL
jgi:ketosteroid isomerase-like protein